MKKDVKIEKDGHINETPRHGRGPKYHQDQTPDGPHPYKSLSLRRCRLFGSYPRYVVMKVSEFTRHSIEEGEDQMDNGKHGRNSQSGIVKRRRTCGKGF